MTHTCPSCGYAGLSIGPQIGNDYSYDICPCCRFQFGKTDMDEGYSYAQWRDKWIQEGMQWWSPSDKIPSDWTPVEQLKNIGVIL